MTSLYQLTDELRQSLDSAFDPETGEALPAFEECRALWGSKARDVTAYVLNCESDAAQCKEVIDRITARQKALKAKAERIRAYLADNMAASGITELKANDGSFIVKLYPQRDESVELDESVTFPPELCNDPKPPTPSKTKIKAAILSGQPVAGATIIKKDRLTIK
jgi:Siphovirus Gp157